MIHKAYKTTITKAGKLGGYNVIPALSKTYGIIIARTEEEVREIEGWEAFNVSIFPMDEFEKGMEINDIISHESLGGEDAKMVSHPILKYFTTEELYSLIGMPEKFYEEVRDYVLDKAKKEKPEQPKEIKSSEDTPKITDPDLLSKIKKRLKELDIPFMRNISLKNAIELLPDGDPLKPVPSEEEVRKEIEEIKANAREE